MRRAVTGVGFWPPSALEVVFLLLGLVAVGSTR